MSFLAVRVFSGRRHRVRCRHWTGALLALGIVVPLAPAAAFAQDPPPPPDPLVVPVIDSLADSLAVDSLADSTAIDSLAVDSTVVAPAVVDSVFDNMPGFGDGTPRGWETGVWSWDQDEIMATGAASLADLIANVPGLVLMLGGDYGAPAGLSAFGLGGGGVRIFRDGFELYPFAGGVPDLARLGLGGIGSVRLVRDLTEVRIEMRSMRHGNARPLSLVEVGTGELDTNIFRGAFVSPRALGGSVGLALERTDTRGPEREEPGSASGTWFRYQWHQGDRWGLAVDMRRISSQTELASYPSSVSRSDWALRARVRPFESLVAEAYFGRSSHSLGDEAGGSGGDGQEHLEGGSRSQVGLRFELSQAGAWARGELRNFGEAGLPTTRLDGSLGFSRPHWGGVEGRVARASWSGESPRALSARAWTAPLGGVLSLFASLESGAYGTRTGVLREIVPEPDSASESTASPEEVDVSTLPIHGTADREGRRLGAALRWRGALVSGALLSVSADTVFPLALATELEASPVPLPAERTGWEWWASIPVPGVQGLRLEGSMQRWDTPSPYLPTNIYRGAFVFHRLYLESGNFEWWWSIGVRGHDSMMLPFYGESDRNGARTLIRVPFYQHWYAHTQARVLSVRLFVRWENIAGREELQSYPGRILPRWRTVYGIRWSMLN